MMYQKEVLNQLFVIEPLLEFQFYQPKKDLRQGHLYFFEADLISAKSLNLQSLVFMGFKKASDQAMSKIFQELLINQRFLFFLTPIYSQQLFEATVCQVHCLSFLKSHHLLNYLKFHHQYQFFQNLLQHYYYYLKHLLLYYSAFKLRYFPLQVLTPSNFQKAQALLKTKYYLLQISQLQLDLWFLKHFILALRLFLFHLSFKLLQIYQPLTFSKMILGYFQSRLQALLICQVSSLFFPIFFLPMNFEGYWSRRCLILLKGQMIRNFYFIQLVL